jgi:hypothetical protein
LLASVAGTAAVPPPLSRTSFDAPDDWPSVLPDAEAKAVPSHLRQPLHRVASPIFAPEATFQFNSIIVLIKAAPVDGGGAVHRYRVRDWRTLATASKICHPAGQLSRAVDSDTSASAPAAPFAPAAPECVAIPSPARCSLKWPAASAEDIGGRRSTTSHRSKRRMHRICLCLSSPRAEEARPRA